MSKHEKGTVPRYKMVQEEIDAVRLELYARSGGQCEHPEGCNETNLSKLTVDHFTPQWVAKIGNWTAEKENDPLNLLLLCRTHHDEKDSQTPKIKQENIAEYAVFKPWAINQRAEQKRKIIALAEKLAA